MAVVGQAKEIVEAREKNIDSKGVRSYKRQFIVKCDNIRDDGNIVLQAIGLPQRYFSYVTDTSQDVGCRCTTITAKQQSGTFLNWIVDVDYSTEHGDKQKEDQEQDNPLLALPEIEWSFETMQQPIWFYPDQVNLSSTTQGYKVTGQIATTAGEVYDPPPTYDESRPVCTIRRNESQFNPVLALNYQNVVNSDVFFSCGPRTAKLRSITAQSQTQKGQFFWSVTYVIAFRRETWDLRLLNYGSYALTAAASTVTVPFTNRDGSLKYGFLKTDGTACALPLASSDVVAGIQTYRVHIEKPFAALNLPFSPNRT